MNADLDKERDTLRRLERIRRAAWEQGALGTPHLDKSIDETRLIIAALQTRHDETPADRESERQERERYGYERC